MTEKTFINENIKISLDFPLARETISPGKQAQILSAEKSMSIIPAPKYLSSKIILTI